MQKRIIIGTVGIAVALGVVGFWMIRLPRSISIEQEQEHGVVQAGASVSAQAAAVRDTATTTVEELQDQFVDIVDSLSSSSHD